MSTHPRQPIAGRPRPKTSARRAPALQATAVATMIGLAFAGAAVPGGVAAQGAPRAEALTTPGILRAGAYGIATSALRVLVDVQSAELPADGQSSTDIVIRLVDVDGRPLRGSPLVTVEVSGGRLQVPGASTDEMGPGRADADRTTPGTQLRIPADSGVLRLKLIAPDTPQDVRLRVTVGEAQADGVIRFVPALREMLALGVIEGVVRMSRKDPNLIQPMRAEDGFDQEIRTLSRDFADGRGNAAARAALFLKGKVRGDALLTLAYDSDKAVWAKMRSVVRQDDYYPVYGDSSEKTASAPSSSKLYVRIDKGRSFIMYGDFSTADGFAPTQGPDVASQAAVVNGAPAQRSLGAYSRTLTGLRGAWAGSGISLAGFAAYDSLKQIVEEFRATGTSGPFVLRNNSGLLNTEKIEVLTRDKDNPGIVKSTRILARIDDYTFEPFSGRILLNRPVASVDAQGDPVSIRVTYEVDQGGDKFWVAGAQVRAALGESASVSASLVDDQNPVSPYRLGSVQLGAQIAQRTWLTAEVARSQSSLWSAGSGLYANPTFQAGESRQDAAGNAARVALRHDGDVLKADASVIRTQQGFVNPSAPMQGGRSEAAVRGEVVLTNTLSAVADVAYSETAAAGGSHGTHGTRGTASIGMRYSVTKEVRVRAGVRTVQENAAWSATGAGVQGITQNPALSSSQVASGGLAGGVDPQAVDPSSGRLLTVVAQPDGQQAGQGASRPIDATTVFVGVQADVTDRITVDAMAEGEVNGGDRYRLVGGASYRLGERSRLIARYEDQSGLTGAYGSGRTKALSLGADTTYMPGGQLFSEYRLRDATSRDAQWANGVRNTWSVSPGLIYTTAAEYLSILDGAGGSAAAIALGVDYTGSQLWKFGSKLELRRQFDNPATQTNERSDSVLSTVSVARKLDRDWTLLVRNYMLSTKYAASDRPVGALGTNAGVGAYTALQDRVQLGAAYRPVDSLRMDVLTKYEYRYSRNADQQLGNTDAVHIGSVQAIYHPSRPVWVSGRVAGKLRTEEGLSAYGRTRYAAALASGRLVYDITENWDLGVMAAGLYGMPGRSLQSAIGVELGYLVQQNLWLSAGFNVRGFNDTDLVGSEYTNSGFFLRLRFKFDEDLFAAGSRSVNRTLDRAPREPATAGQP